jgi:predicted  nucleic acid-binding Zn-ribbon protein
MSDKIDDVNLDLGPAMEGAKAWRKRVEKIEDSVDEIKESIEDLTEKIAKLAVSLVEYKKDNNAKVVEDMKQQLASVAATVAKSQPPKAKPKNLQTRAPSGISTNRPIPRSGAGR